MNKAPMYLGALALGGVAVGLGQIHSATAGQDRTRGGDGNRSGQLIGADVIVGSINGVQKWSSSNGVSSYSLGTTSCNIGDQVLSWESGNMLHPVKHFIFSLSSMALWEFKHVIYKDPTTNFICMGRDQMT